MRVYTKDDGHWRAVASQITPIVPTPARPLLLIISIISFKGGPSSALSGGSAIFISRRRNNLTPSFPTLQQISHSIKAETAVLDGEMVALGQSGTLRFEGLRSNTSGFVIVYFAFDLLHMDGKDLTQRPVIERKKAQSEFCPRRPIGKIRYTDHIVGEGKRFFEELYLSMEQFSSGKSWLALNPDE